MNETISMSCTNGEVKRTLEGKKPTDTFEIPGADGVSVYATAKEITELGVSGAYWKHSIQPRPEYKP